MIEQHRPAVPGAATRRFLRACDERRPQPVDWSLAPARYKRYPGAARIALDPADWRGELLRNMLGLTRLTWRQPHDEAGQPAPGRTQVVIGRPAPSGGALYPIEAYAATADALCHYDVAHHALEVLRVGDHRQLLTGLLTGPPAACDPPPELVLALTAVFWRNGFKYDDFAYRLQCQETGVLAAQALALADQLDLDVTVHVGFDGETADRLLDLAPAAEGGLAILTFTRSGCPPGPPPAGETARAAGPPSPVTSRLPHLAALHAATRMLPPSSANPASANPASANTASANAVESATVPPLSSAGTITELPEVTPVRVGDGVSRRVSPVNGYRPQPAAAADLARILVTCTAGYPGDLPGAVEGPRATALYVLVLNVAGIKAGVFRYLPGRRALAAIGGRDLLTAVVGGPLRPNTLAALRTCAAVVIPAGNPLAGTGRYGDLWYRLQQTETGLVVHRATLAATALGLTGRIHSDGTNPATDAALGLAATSWRSLSFLLLGSPRASGPERRG